MKGKLVYGVGRYEKGKFKSKENSKPTKVYSAWKNMLQRCYDPKWHAKHPTYIGCTVRHEWLDFQTFAQWYEDNYPQDGDRYQLDKDLKVLGNKVYSPEACLFVSSVVNKFTLDNRATRGNLPIGLNWHKRSGKFKAQCKNQFTGKHEHLGLFTDEMEAHLAWRARKSELAYELAMEQDNPEVKDALLSWRDALDGNKIHAV